MFSQSFLTVETDLRCPWNSGLSGLWLLMLTVLDVKTELDFIVIYLVTITIIKLFKVSINKMFVIITIFSKTERKIVRTVSLYELL